MNIDIKTLEQQDMKMLVHSASSFRPDIRFSNNT